METLGETRNGRKFSEPKDSHLTGKKSGVKRGGLTISRRKKGRKLLGGLANIE